MTARLLLAAFALLLVLPACGGKSGADRMVGTWTLDPEMMKETDEYKKAPPEERAMMDQMMKSMKMEVTFTSDKMKMNSEMTFMGQTRTQKQEASYRVLSEEGDKLVVESTDDKGKVEKVDVVVKGDELSFTVEGKAFTMRRK